MRNYDRHGMTELAHEEVKPLDRLKLPPWVIYMMVFSLFATVAYTAINDQDLDIEKLTRKNMLLAMKKT